MEEYIEFFDINNNLILNTFKDFGLLIQSITIPEAEIKEKQSYEQIDLFTNYEEINKRKKQEEKEKNLQYTMINIKKKYGKNAILKGMNLVEGGTTIERNGQVGGHKE